jgi:hypothetical protein
MIKIITIILIVPLLSFTAAAYSAQEDESVPIKLLQERINNLQSQINDIELTPGTTMPGGPSGRSEYTRHYELEGPLGPESPQRKHGQWGHRGAQGTIVSPIQSKLDIGSEQDIIGEGQSFRVAKMTPECPCWTTEILHPTSSHTQFYCIDHGDTGAHLYTTLVSESGVMIMYEVRYSKTKAQYSCTGEDRYIPQATSATPITEAEAYRCREILVNSQMWKRNCSPNK